MKRARKSFVVFGKIKKIIYERDGLLFEHRFKSRVYIVTDGQAVILEGKALRVTTRGIQDT